MLIAKDRINMFATKPMILTGRAVQLEPLQSSHREELYHAAQDEAIWTYTGTKAFGKQFMPWFDKACLAFSLGNELPFAIRRLTDQKIIGSTRYYDIDSEHHRLAIGYTWLISEVWGSAINSECKFLLLKFAFEDYQVNRVQLVTDTRNARSRVAILKLGAKEEGLLRQHMILEDGYVRDTYIFSIIKPDWPQVKSALESRLKKIKHIVV